MTVSYLILIILIMRIRVEFTTLNVYLMSLSGIFMKYDRKTYIDFTSFVVSDRSMIWYYIKNFTKPFLWNEFKDLTPYKLGLVRSVILHNEITFKDEVEEQSNFPDYALLHI
ncbi:MAG: hypothetical protein ACI9T7_001406 [Oleiphilaceae bacterium]|jgi:hypothetical protein